ncbi:MAG: MerR family transcriptional regulator [Lachnospiraceae bacterium]|nr:MerR family transcriptional regulator [Lachnospiraceae bacterium]
MNIKEVEEQTGLPRSNIRFYEKENLILPLRNEKNGYRVYSEKDVENIKKIADLRTLGLSVENIRNIIEEKISLQESIQQQYSLLDKELKELENAKILCEKMLSTPNINYDTLNVQKYVTELPEYWSANRSVFKLDSVSFLYIWGSFITWAVITMLCLSIGLLFYPKLPPEIPIQYSHGSATSFANKHFIFAYPIICILVRYILRFCIYAKFQMNNAYNSIIAEYLTNFICFIVLSAEVFSILFIYHIVKNIVFLLFIDTAVFILILIIGLTKLSLNEK